MSPALQKKIVQLAQEFLPVFKRWQIDQRLHESETLTWREKREIRERFLGEETVDFFALDETVEQAESEALWRSMREAEDEVRHQLMEQARHQPPGRRL